MSWLAMTSHDSKDCAVYDTSFQWSVVLASTSTSVPSDDVITSTRSFGTTPSLKDPDLYRNPVQLVRYVRLHY